MRVVVLFGLVVGCTARYSGAKHDVGLMRSLGLNPNRPLPAEYTAVGEACFNQTLDHDDAGSPVLWKQRYQFNETFSKVGGPVFLLLGGEGPASPIWLAADTAIMTYARQVGAAVYQLEHRFYGESQPFEDLTTSHLKYLSTPQALADADNFVRSFVFSKHGANTKVVSFGGSYSGALSAWLRFKYPNTIYAAVSTSSPIVAVEDFVAYQQVVQNSLATANGGQTCVDRIGAVTASIEKATMTEEGLKGLATTYNTCAQIQMTTNEIANLMSTLAGSFDGVVQYNDDNRQFEHPDSPKPPDLTTVCSAVVGGATPQAGYTAAQQLITDFKDQCMDVSYTGMISQMQNTSLQSGVAGGSRQWVWQTCTEFGYFQSSNGSSTTQPFGSLFPADFSVQQCTDIYGTPSAAVSMAIDATNNMYGGADYNGSRVIFVNGDIDPWHALSLPPQQQSSADVTSILIQGTAHCANMYPASSADLPGLTAARTAVAAALARWV